MLSICGLHEVKTFGGKYTWAGNRYTYSIKTKIDRVFSTSRWQDTFPKAHVKMLSWIGSDHRPLLLNTEDNKWKGKKYFRYDNRWKYFPEIKNIIEQAWKSQCAHLSPFKFSEALARCRDALAKWKLENITNSQNKIAELQSKLHQAYESPFLDYHYIGYLNHN